MLEPGVVAGNMAGCGGSAGSVVRSDRRDVADSRRMFGERSLFRVDAGRDATAGCAGVIVGASRLLGSTVRGPQGWEFATPQASIMACGA